MKGEAKFFLKKDLIMLALTQNNEFKEDENLNHDSL